MRHRAAAPAVLAAAAVLTAAGCSGGASADGAEDVEGATLHTSEGVVEVAFFPESAPETVLTFAGLAEGELAENPETGERAFYDGTVFHRVIPGFMVQGGDPTGTGTGGPGFTFDDEIDPGLEFDRPGLLAMANSGPDTNGSQFFITTAPAEHLNGLHTVFGEVTEGQEVVEAISQVETDGADKPVEDVVLESVEIHRADG
ncbi:peptidylprolyl isomerase [Nocardiopsis sp. RSe5-2]|uniref:Peptidyl-prolyl cis-trans isomerase n=1 Tax=Nocardiopsis endophytica TaxID=3018445 RepID=A0ABT4TX68_9ACTN|nr:peptidylprolyl isomerase [Nocardiopsis endophytica]MDA2809297.1 peptidylprolyl isomerase [Nocardiopsis endophytica]